MSPYDPSPNLTSESYTLQQAIASTEKLYPEYFWQSTPTPLQYFLRPSEAVTIQPLLRQYLYVTVLQTTSWTIALVILNHICYYCCKMKHRLCHTGSCTLSLLQHETILPLFFPLLLSFLTRRVSVYDCFMFTDTAMVCHTVYYPPQLSSDVCCAKSKLWSSGATPSTSQELKRPQHLTVHIMLYDS